MCRFLIYKGQEMLMADLLTRADQSLIHQSYRARERKEPLNGDGFGVGWYAPDVEPTPAVVTSITPAWSNRNLHNLADKVRCTILFAHVRAASVGMRVSDLNCHPFQYQQYLWMHNGRIPDFGKIKRRLRESLPDELYNMIQGTTDSEHAFALFLHQLQLQGDGTMIGDLEQAMLATIEQLNRWTREAAIAAPGTYNFAVTDSDHIVVTRYVSKPEMAPESLYIAEGERFAVHDGRYRMFPMVDEARAVIIASEPLTSEQSGWLKVPENHLLSVTPAMRIRLQAIAA